MHSKGYTRSFMRAYSHVKSCAVAIRRQRVTSWVGAVHQMRFGLCDSGYAFLTRSIILCPFFFSMEEQAISRADRMCAILLLLVFACPNCV